MSVNDLERNYYAAQLGLNPTTLSVADLQALFLAAGQYGIASNKKYFFNKYYGPELPGNNSAFTPVLNDLVATPFIVAKKQNFDRLACACFTAATAASGAVVRLGVYDTASNGDVQNLIASMAPTSIETTGVKEGNIALTLNPGIYWLAFCVQVSIAGPPQFRGIGSAWSPLIGIDDPNLNSASAGYIQSGVSGSLPSPFVTSHASAGLAGGTVPRVMLRTS